VQARRAGRDVRVLVRAPRNNGDLVADLSGFARQPVAVAAYPCVGNRSADFS
jgi:hypothetical protein